MFLANENAISSGNYLISNSLRVLGSNSSAYLSRTPASAGNRRTWTYSAWVKRGNLTPAVGGQSLFYAGSSTTTPRGGIVIGNAGDDKLSINGMLYNSTSSVLSLETSAQYRDPSAWYHIVVSLDTTQATSSDRCKIYVNGVQVTAFGTATYPSLNQELQYNDAILHATRHPSANYYYDGYIAELNFIDGQALTPAAFGETDATSGQWVAKKYAGTYGTNGFYLPFSNGTSTTTLGADSSGNGNNWTLTNFTRSAGTSDCWMKDVPSGNGGASGTQPNSNYAVLNGLDKNTAITVSNANLQLTTASTNVGIRSSISMKSGKWYWETYINSIGGGEPMVGIALSTWGMTYLGNTALNSAGYAASGTLYMSYTGGTGTPSAYTTGDIIGTAYDADTNQISFYKNGVAQIVGATLNYSGENFPAYSLQANTFNANFGQRSFAYTPPSGFKALCTANLPVATIVKGNQYMDATIWSGDNTAPRSIVNAGGFSPDLVWIKNRSSASFFHFLTDTVRGANNSLQSNTTSAEFSNDVNGYLSAFNSNGFSVINGSSGNGNSNNVGNNYVAWQWDAGSSTVTNTSGTISSQVRANTTAGFSIVTYTGTGANATVGHGLGVAPKFIIVKERSAAQNWAVYANAAGGADRYLSLNTTSAYTLDSTVFRSIDPTSSVFNIGTSALANANTQTYVAYCFAEIAGFSKFGSYTGNGSADGPFVYCGFRPKFVMVKNNAIASNWLMYDTQRDLYNVTENTLIANSSGAEGVYADVKLDVLSNGFKIRQTSTNLNGNGNILIYMAFAENPLAQSNAR